MARQLSVNRQTTWGGLDVLKNKVVNNTVIGKFTNSFCIPIVPFTRWECNAELPAKNNVAAADCFISQYKNVNFKY